MSNVEMSKLMPPALGQDVEPRVPACRTDGAAMENPSIRQMLQAQRITELEKACAVLVKDRRDLQCLLYQQQVEHEAKLKAFDWEMMQEGLQWERYIMANEDTLLSSLMVVDISKRRLMSDLKSLERQSLAHRHALVPAVKINQDVCKKASPDATLQSTHNLGGADGKLDSTVQIQERKSRTWWCFKKHQATADFGVQDASTSSRPTSKDAALQKITKLEERLRKAELKKQQKAAKKAAKAEKEAKKVEEKRLKKEAKEAKKAEEKRVKKAEKEAKKAKKNSLQGQAV